MARFRRPLAAFAGRFGLRHDQVGDVVQETLAAFAEAYRRGKYDPEQGRLSNWLWGIAYRQALNAQRKQARLAERAVAAAGSTFWGQVPDTHEAQEAWDADWERAALEACLQQARGEFAERTFRVFEMVVREDRDPAEVAGELGMTREAVYVAKHRVLKRLGELVKAYEH